MKAPKADLAKLGESPRSQRRAVWSRSRRLCLGEGRVGLKSRVVLEQLALSSRRSLGASQARTLGRQPELLQQLDRLRGVCVG